MGMASNVKKNLLLLDLDGTLITSISSYTKYSPDFIFSYSKKHNYNVFKRPCLDVFIDKCFEMYEVGIWTASKKEYAEFISKKIFGTRYQKLSLFFYGTQSLFDGVKSIHKLTQKHDLHDYNIVLLDNDPFHCNQSNSVKIKSYIPSSNSDLKLIDSLSYIKVIFESLNDDPDYENV
jgi:TFIIF-interacting CTD phosphatase-like protein